MNKNYIIWGISDRGYEDSISSSYPNNVIPAEFKASVSDNHRQYAFAFARENPNEHYFYSIEQVGSDVLYTIFRTNFKGGSTGNRLAYDAATIIISKNHIIEKPLNSLKLLISSYITQKDSGFGNFDFENALAGIRLLANNDKRSISKRYKSGYIKYHSETELSSVLVDKKDKLHNFNKVYFFIRLNFFEQGENKIQDLKDYKAIPVKIINFDARYYRIYVENKPVDVFGESLKVYEGDEIKIYKVKGNTPQNVELAKTGLTITLKKIKPPKPKPQLTDQDIRRKRKNKDKLANLAIALCSVVILATLGFALFEKEIQKLVNTTNKDKKNNETVESEKKENYEFVFDGEYFINSKKDTIQDVNRLLACFKDSIYFINDNILYKLHFTDDDWKISNDKGVSLKVDALKELKVKIEKANKLADTKKIVSHIDKVIQYNKLLVEGLKFQKNILKIVVKSKTSRSYIMSSNESNIQKFSKLDKKKIIGKVNLEIFLTDILPKNIFNEIFYQKEFNNNKEVDKTNVKPDTRKSKVKTVCSLTKKHKEVLAIYWSNTITCFRNWSEKEKYIKRLNVRIKDASAIIEAYEACSCSKCKQNLNIPNLIRVKDEIKLLK